MEHGTYALSAQELSVHIQRIPILRSFSLSVGPGELVGLVGRNGAGKTTLMRAIMGLLPVADGTLAVEGKSLLQLSVDQRARLGIGYMPEDRGLIGPLTVEENLKLPCWAQKLPNAEARIDQALSRVPELRERLQTKALSLSGGQQKLVALARALVCGDKLLLLDEPFEGVSPVLSQRLMQLVSEARAMGISVLVSQSETKHSLSVFDRVYEMERGSNAARH